EGPACELAPRPRSPSTRLAVSLVGHNALHCCPSPPRRSRRDGTPRQSGALRHRPRANAWISLSRISRESGAANPLLTSGQRRIREKSGLALDGKREADVRLLDHDLAHEAVVGRLSGAEPEVATRLLGHLLHVVAAALA